MNKKTIMSTLLLLVAIGGAMLYLQRNESDKIEQTVMRVEAERPIEHDETDLHIAMYLMYYMRNEFFSLEEAAFYSKVEVLNDYAVIQYMQAQDKFLTNEDLAYYQRQSADQVEYEMKHVPGAAFFERMFQTLNITKKQYVSYIYEKRIAADLYSKLYNEIEQPPYEEIFDTYAKKHGTSFDEMMSRQEKLMAMYKPVEHQPNWFPEHTGITELLEHTETGHQQFTPYSMYNLYAVDDYAEVMRFIEQQIGGPLTRETIDKGLEAVKLFESEDEKVQQARDNIEQILTFIHANNEPFLLP